MSIRRAPDQGQDRVTENIANVLFSKNSQCAERSCPLMPWTVETLGAIVDAEIALP